MNCPELVEALENAELKTDFFAQSLAAWRTAGIPAPLTIRHVTTWHLLILASANRDMLYRLLNTREERDQLQNLVVTMGENWTQLTSLPNENQLLLHALQTTAPL